MQWGFDRMKTVWNDQLLAALAKLIGLAVTCACVVSTASAQGTLESVLLQDGKISNARIEVTGAKAVDPALLRAIAQKYETRPSLTASDLEAMRLEMTQVYLGLGFISSGALIDTAQPVAGNTIKVTMIEGKLRNIQVEGNGWLSAGYVSNRARRGIDGPFNMNDAGTQVQLLLQDPMITRVDARVQPGGAMGETDLLLAVEPRRMYDAVYTVANDRAPSVGSVRQQFDITARNLSGWGDTWQFNVTSTKGLTGGGARFSMPVTASDLTIFGSAQINDTLVVEEAFQDLKIQGRSQDFEAGVQWPLIKTPFQTLLVGAAASHRFSETELLEESFSFTPGAVNGQSRATVAKLTQDWVYRITDGILAARSSLNFGLDIATDLDKRDCACLPAITTPTPDAQYFYWQMQFQYGQRVTTGFEFSSDVKSLFVIRLNGQWAEDSLLPMERMSIGGSETVRGYRNNTLVRDSGVVASAEFQLPILQWSPVTGTSAGIFEIAGFADYGFGANREQASIVPNPNEIDEIYSVGAGLRWNALPNFNLELYGAYDLRNLPKPEDTDLQDYGVHFAATFDAGQMIHDLVE